MCGRYSLHTEPEELARLFRLPIDEVLRMFDVAPRYNIAPTDTVLAVRAGRDRDRRPAALRWGLVPPWANNVSMGARTINARAETLLERPAFRDPFQEKRCLILADGFYEWRKLPTRRQPYLIRLKSGAPFAFAGLWDHWKPQKTGAHRILRDHHDRTERAHHDAARSHAGHTSVAPAIERGPQKHSTCS